MKRLALGTIAALALMAGAPAAAQAAGFGEGCGLFILDSECPPPGGPEVFFDQAASPTVTATEVTVHWFTAGGGSYPAYADLWEGNIEPGKPLIRYEGVYAGATSHTFSGLTPNTRYGYSVVPAHVAGGGISGTVTTLKAPTGQLRRSAVRR